MGFCVFVKRFGNIWGYGYIFLFLGKLIPDCVAGNTLPSRRALMTAQTKTKDFTPNPALELDPELRLSLYWIIAALICLGLALVVTFWMLDRGRTCLVRQRRP